MPAERVFSTFDVNVFAILRMVRAVFPHMAARKSGTIVNIGSIAGEAPLPWGGAYAATKAGVRSISESLYMECAPFNIHVTYINAGGVHTNIAENGLNSFRLVEGTLYSNWLDAMLSRIRMNETTFSMPPQKFAQQVVRNALGRRPSRHVTLGAGSRIFTVFKWLPRGVLLWIAWKLMAGTPSVNAV